MISILSMTDTQAHTSSAGVTSSVPNCPDKTCPSCWSSTVFWTVLVVGAAYYYVAYTNTKNRVTNSHSSSSSLGESSTSSSVNTSSPLKHDKAVTAQPTSVSTYTSTVSPSVQNTATNTSEFDTEPTTNKSSPPSTSSSSSKNNSPRSSLTSSSDEYIEVSKVKDVVQGLNQLNAEKKRTISELNQQLSSSQALSKEAMSLYEQETKLRLKSENELKSIILQAQGLLSGPLADTTASSFPSSENSSADSEVSVMLEFLREIAAKQ